MLKKTSQGEAHGRSREGRGGLKPGRTPVEYRVTNQKEQVAVSRLGVGNGRGSKKPRGGRRRKNRSKQTKKGQGKKLVRTEKAMGEKANTISRVKKK